MPCRRAQPTSTASGTTPVERPELLCQPRSPETPLGKPICAVVGEDKGRGKRLYVYRDALHHDLGITEQLLEYRLTESRASSASNDEIEVIVQHEKLLLDSLQPIAKSSHETARLDGTSRVCLSDERVSVGGVVAYDDSIE